MNHKNNGGKTISPKSNREFAGKETGKAGAQSENIEAPEPELILPPPTLGGGARPRGPGPQAGQAPVQNTPEEIKAWGIQEATQLKTAHAAQQQELETQRENALAAKVQELGRQFDRQLDQCETTRQEISDRQGRGGLAGILYRMSGQSGLDQQLAEANMQNKEWIYQQRGRELDNFEKSWDQQMDHFNQRCANEVEELKQRIDQAHQEKRIPDQEHSHDSSHTHGDGEGHQR